MTTLTRLLKAQAHDGGWEYTYGFKQGGETTYLTLFTESFVTPQEVLFLDEVSRFVKTDKCASAFITKGSTQVRLK